MSQLGCAGHKKDKIVRESQLPSGTYRLTGSFSANRGTEVVCGVASLVGWTRKEKQLNFTGAEDGWHWDSVLGLC